jgi:putative transposase
MFEEVIAKTLAGWKCQGRTFVKRLVKPTCCVSRAVAGIGQDVVRSRIELLAENALLRQQIIVLRRSVKKPTIHRGDRLIMLVCTRFTSAWKTALDVVQPDTLLRWHRDLFKWVWKRKSRPKSQPKKLGHETIDLIKEMAVTNATWGAERIRGELLKLGIRVSKRTVQKYVRQARPSGEPRGQAWETFVDNHTGHIWACDFLQLNDALFRPIFAFFIVKHGTREVVHFNVTRSTSDSWVTQQLRESTPYGRGPRYLIRDNDRKFGGMFDAVANSSDIEQLRIPPRSPNLNPICERFLGSVRRECLIIAFPVLGGLHHDYRRAA